MDGAVTLHNGSAQGHEMQMFALGGTADSVYKAGPGVIYGDLNHDGKLDAVTQLDDLDGNSPYIELSAWLGTDSGKPRQLGKPFIRATDCGTYVKTATIDAEGIIHVTGADGANLSCAESSNGPAFEATYKVNGDTVQTLTPPPSSGY